MFHGAHSFAAPCPQGGGITIPLRPYKTLGFFAAAFSPSAQFPARAKVAGIAGEASEQMVEGSAVSGACREFVGSLSGSCLELWGG